MCVYLVWHYQREVKKGKEREREREGGREGREREREREREGEREKVRPLSSVYTPECGSGFPHWVSDIT